MASIRISEETKQSIIKLHQEGYCNTDISSELGISRNTVRLWIKRWREEGALVNRASFGRPRKTSSSQDTAIARKALADRFIDTTQLAVVNEVSRSTIRRRLNEAGLKHRVPAKKPQLTPRQKQLRLEFALQFKDYDFKRVAFLDEKIFCCSEQGRLSLWQVNNTKYVGQTILPDSGSGCITIGFWGWMSAAGPGVLMEIGGRLNGQEYKKIIDDVFLPSARNVYPDEERIKFCHSSCYVHNTKVVSDYISSNNELELITLPPKSPDLNPIENVWNKIIGLWNHQTQPSAEVLCTHVNQEWDSLRSDTFCNDSVQSMRERLLDVIKANGDYLLK